MDGSKADVFDDEPEVWSKRQISKIVIIMSDSCAGAQRTKRLLSGVIIEKADNQDMVIFEVVTFDFEWRKNVWPNVSCHKQRLFLR